MSAPQIGPAVRPVPRRQSPAASALGEHARHCRLCQAVATAGMRYTLMCQVGRDIAAKALARRAA